MPQDDDATQWSTFQEQHLNDDRPLKISRTGVQQPDRLNEIDRVKTLRQGSYVQGDQWYVVPVDWITRWEAHCSRGPDSAFDTEAAISQPGSIDMRRFVDMNGELVPNLEFARDVDLIPAAAWEFLAERYDVQSGAITRRVLENGVQPSLYPQYTIHILQHNGVTERPSVTINISQNSTLGNFLRMIKSTTHLDHLSFSLWSMAASSNMTDKTDPTVKREQVDLSNPRQTIADMDRHGTRIFAIQLEEAPGGVEEMPSTPADDDHNHVADHITADSFDQYSPVHQTSTDSNTMDSIVVTESSSSIMVTQASKSDDDEPSVCAPKIDKDDGNNDSTSNTDDGYASLANLYSLDNADSTAKTEDDAVEQEEQPPQYESGYCGLSNMGNTCYMNSALQCLSNTEELTRYFFEGRHVEELNRDNPLGMQGELAEAYGSLIREIWSGCHSHLTPRKFKVTISRYNSTFVGYRQHDSQELLSFLLDGLHEDLNRIKQKPYVEMRDFENMLDTDIAKQCWEYHKARNDSVIVDIFQGQFKSRLECNECGKVSIMFDPFMYLSLPLPVSKKTRLKIVYVPYDPSERQKKMTITFEHAASIEDLKKQVAKKCNVNDPSKLLVLEIYQNGIFKMFPHYEPISTILPQDSIFVYELPCPMPVSVRLSTPSSRKSKLRKLEGGSSPVEPAELQDDDAWVVFPVYCATVAEGRDQFNQFGGPVLVAVPPEDIRDPDAIYGRVVRHIERFAAIKLFDVIKDDQMTDMSPAVTSEENPSAMDVDPTSGSETQPKMIHTPAAVIAAGGRRMGPMTNLFTMKVFTDTPEPDSAIPLSVPTSNARGVVDDLEERAGRMSASPPKTEEREGGYTNPMTPPPAATDKSTDASSDKASSSSSNSTGDDNSAGSSERQPIQQQPLIKQGEGMMIVWKKRRAEQVFGISLGKTVPTINTDAWDDMAEENTEEEPENPTPASARDEQQDLSLGRCLQEFSKEEVLGDNDLWYCPRCKKHQHAKKKIDLWHMPDILVIHLKRFSNTRALRDKIDVLVDFPVQGLDLTDMVASNASDRERLKSISNANPPQEDSRVLYDLYAVDNHYGGMGGGHYTAFAQNPVTKEWLKFNDSHVSAVDDTDNIKTNAAYLLFYKRRGTELRTENSVSQVPTSPVAENQ